MRENYQPKFDYEIWRERIMEDLKNTMSTAYRKETAGRARVWQVEEDEKQKIVKSGWWNRNKQPDLLELEKGVNIALKALREERVAVILAAIEKYNSESAIIQEEQGIDTVAASLTQEKIGEVIRQVEEEVLSENNDGEFIDAELNAYLNKAEQSWGDEKDLEK